MVSRAWAATAAVVVVVGLWAGPTQGQAPVGTSAQARAGAPDPGARRPGLTTIAATDSPALEQWDQRVNQMVKSGELKLRETMADALVAGRTHQRYAQLHKGVPVFGGDVSRQVDNRKTVSIFGAVYRDITINPVPKLTTTDAAAIFQKMAGSSLGPSRTPELMVLPSDDGGYRLTYRARIATADDVIMAFVDATTGETVLSVSDLKRP